jgi:hypothetical protein
MPRHAIVRPFAQLERFTTRSSIFLRIVKSSALSDRIRSGKVTENHKLSPLAHKKQIL